MESRNHRLAPQWLTPSPCGTGWLSRASNSTSFQIIDPAQTQHIASEIERAAPKSGPLCELRPAQPVSDPLHAPSTWVPTALYISAERNFPSRPYFLLPAFQICGAFFGSFSA